MNTENTCAWARLRHAISRRMVTGGTAAISQNC
jgi:hypothetical protein